MTWNSSLCIFSVVLFIRTSIQSVRLFRRDCLIEVFCKNYYRIYSNRHPGTPRRLEVYENVGLKIAHFLGMKLSLCTPEYYMYSKN